MAAINIIVSCMFMTLFLRTSKRPMIAVVSATAAVAAASSSHVVFNAASLSYPSPGFVALPTRSDGSRSRHDVDATTMRRRSTNAQHRLASSSSLFGSSSLSSASSTVDTDTAIINDLPLPLPPLDNYYYLLRHGQSTANVDGIISSSRNLAYSAQHGLTLLGIQQGKEAATSLLDLIDLDIKNSLNNHHDIPASTKRVYFYSSPFARAKETAEACLTRLSLSPESIQRAQTMGIQINNTITYHDGLMERYFGRLDGKELSTYAYVWPVDMFDPTHTAFDVESVAAVCNRIRSTLLEIDSRHVGEDGGSGGGNHIVLTSHADVLQITQVYAAGLDNVGRFSQYRFGNGEVRRMGRDVGSLPEAKPLEPPKRGE